MPVPVGQMGVPGGGQPTCFQKIRMGFMMGCMIGGATGVLLGGFASLRMGLRGAELIKQTGKVVAQSGGSFGVFMAVAQGLMHILITKSEGKFDNESEEKPPQKRHKY